MHREELGKKSGVLLTWKKKLPRAAYPRKKFLKKIKEKLERRLNKVR
jgi:hypothetical protein